MTRHNPLVSVVTPSFNKGPFIKETIQSIQDQSYSHIEHIVIDGGSTDETLAILKKYEGQISWVSEPDRGQSHAINKGWERARGEIIAYLNADDTYTRDAVETAVTYLNEHPDVGMVYGDGIMTDERGRFLEEGRAGEFSLRELVYCRDAILQPAVFLRKSVYDRIGGIDESLHLAMDLDYWIRVGLLFQVVHIPHILATAKVYGDAKSVALMHRYVSDYEHILEKVFADSYLPPELAAEKNAVYNYVYVKGGLDFIHLGRRREGMRYLGKAFRMNPFRCAGNVLALLGRYGYRNIIGRR
ncbi:glycosyltransferase family 2 protein [Methanoregula sp.]|uniref:glycosyltransferase family 2 protein n=1 Tax=Methanoregula sp. TaxID=2052170 RepID=UPI0023692FED|nr:glycosyltransferase family 2 protein [Methanoregula sp.]MDD1687193.1 glycosyltransferase [Methanoregula sp.]